MTNSSSACHLRITATSHTVWIMNLRNRLCVIAALLAVPVLLGLASNALSRPAGPPDVGDTTITIPVRDHDSGHASGGGGSRDGGGGDDE